MSEKGKKEFESLLPSLSQLTNVIQPEEKKLEKIRMKITVKTSPSL